MIRLEAKHADQQRQREPLQDERAEDDAEGQEDEQVTIRKGSPGIRGQRDRECSGQGDGAAHAGPGDQEGVAERLGRMARAVPQPSRQVGEDRQPDDPRQDHRSRHEHPVAHQLAGGAAREIVEDARQLQAHEREQQRVEDEHDDLPDRDPLKPGLHRSQLRCAPAEIDAGRDDREHARRLGCVRGDEREVTRHQGDRHLDGRVFEPAPHLGREVTDDQADPDPADDAPDEPPGGVPDRERSRHDRHHRNAIEDERRAVVDEALALDDRDEASGDAKPAHDRRRSDRIGRRDDGAEHKRGAPRQPGYCGMGDDGNRDRRRDHEADGEDANRASVRPQVPHRREEGGEVDQRRQDGDEHDLRRELQGRDAGDETEPFAHSLELRPERIRDAGLEPANRARAPAGQEHALLPGLA